MRPVNKGEAPKEYTKYNDARDDLFERIGMYCSYCEMVIKNMPAVEHVIPRDNGGEELNWDNFLLSCWYCNSNKGSRNKNREGYLWPDKDNTFKAFKYDYGVPISVNDQLIGAEKTKAENTIELFALDREPNTDKWKNHKDMRPISRMNTWAKAKESLKDWEAVPVEQVAKAICRTATSEGHFSIWMKVFEKHKSIIEMFIDSFKGTEKRYFEQE